MVALCTVFVLFTAHALISVQQGLSINDLDKGLLAVKHLSVFASFYHVGVLRLPLQWS